MDDISMDPNETGYNIYFNNGAYRLYDVTDDDFIAEVYTWQDVVEFVKMANEEES